VNVIERDVTTANASAAKRIAIEAIMSIEIA
jgi:hypothetical protein